MARFTRDILKYRDPLSCLALVLFVFYLFDDIVFRGLNQTLAGLDTGVPNDDALIILFPFFSHLIDSLKETGALDPWNPYIWGGTPAIGNPNIPFNVLLYGLFHLGKRGFIVAMNWHLVVEFCLAATGMYLIARKLAFHWPLCVLASVLAVCSSSAAWLTNTYCIFFHWAVIPWVLLLLLTQEKRKPTLTTLYLGVILYFQLTYGQAQMTVYSLAFFLLCVLWIFRERFDRKQSLVVLGAGYFVAGCLALHSLLPQVEFLLHASNRQSESWATTAAHYRVSPHYLLNLFVPGVFWSPIPWWPTWSDGWSPWESFNVYIGLFFALIAFYGFRQIWQRAPFPQRPPFASRLKWLILGLIVLDCTVWGGLALVGLNFGKDVPYSRATHFLLYPLIFTALSEIHICFSSRKEIAKLLGFLTLALISVGLLSRNFSSFVLSLYGEATRVSEGYSNGALAQQFLSLHREALSGIFLQSATLLLTLMGLLIAALLFYKRPRVRSACVFSLLLFSLIDLVGFFRAHRQRGTEPYPYRQTLQKTNPLLEAFRTRVSDLDSYAFSTYTLSMETETGLAPNQNALWRVPSVNGYSSFTLQEDAFAPKFYRGNWGYAYPEIAVKLLSIKYILLGPRTRELPYQNKLKPIAKYGDYLLTEYMDPVSRFYFPAKISWGVSAPEQKEKLLQPGASPLTHSYASAPGGAYEAPPGCSHSVRIIDGNASEKVLSLQNDCTRSVFFAFPHARHPWWRTTLNGKPASVFAANLGHQLVEVAPGVHRLSLELAPTSWYVGIALSLFTALLLVGIFGIATRDRRSNELYTAKTRLPRRPLASSQ